MELVERLRLRGLELPVLIRFNDILKNRLVEIHGAFEQAIQDHDYQGRYCCVYPIKVNQQRQVVEQILEHGRKYGFGLEAGSKPELLAVIALVDDDRPIICNGFKDGGFIEMALMAQKIGRRVIPVVEKYTELELILRYAEKAGSSSSDRHAGETGRARSRPLAVVGRLSVQVRIDGQRGAARPGTAAVAWAWPTA